MPFKFTEDIYFGDCYFGIPKSDNSLIRPTLKIYERTVTYVFLKLFKKETHDYEFEQRISLNFGEFENFISSASKMQDSVMNQQSSTKQPPAK